MNRMDLISAVAERTELPRKDAEAAVNAVTEAIADSLREGEKVQLLGFGTFEVKDRAARTGRDPHTQETINIPAFKAVVFKAGKALKDSIQ